MKVIAEAAPMQRLALRWRDARERIALVPTMGALHRGHIELIRVARKKARRVVVSIYVNPTQFGPREDLARYPRPRRDDLRICREEGVDVVFAPASLYPADFSTWVEEMSVSLDRCGASRPGHFRGVTTVVLKLFNIVQPHLACFGRKDAQQLEVITRMVRDLNVPVQIVPVETVREADGLALSSRNRFLTPEDRLIALALPRGLREAVTRPKPAAWLKQKLARAGIEVDYVEAVSGRLCAAIRVGTTRLIDNVELPSR